MSYEIELEFAKKLAYEAGTIMRRYFKAVDIGTSLKADNTPLTVADTKINKLVIDRVKVAFPNDGILGEEESFKPERDRIWVVDPIDGTVPFSLDMPISTFLLALVNRSDGQPVVAVAFDPYLDHLYTAIKGDGAVLNGARLASSQTMELFQSYVSVYGPPTKTAGINYKPGRVIDQLRTKGVHNLSFASGGYAAAKIASGNFAAVLMGSKANPWDCAAPCLLVREAGGVVTDLAGNTGRYDGPGFGCVLAANQSILTGILELVKGPK